MAYRLMLMQAARGLVLASLWGELLPRASELGLATLHGSAQMSASRATRSAAESASTIANTGSPATG